MFFLRFENKRIEEDLEVLRRKASRLRTETEGSAIIEKLQLELGEYREILKCTICLDRTKQVCTDEVLLIYEIVNFNGAFPS